jgi:high affinity sulfate transporter 1
LPAIEGLWAAVGALFAYALLGSSRQLSAGPESSTALMTAAALAALGGSDPGQWPVIAAALALGTGLLCLIGRLARLGFLADLLSKPVLIGYMCGIAVLMIVSQLSKVTGIAVHGESVLGELASVAQQLDQINVPTMVLSVMVIGLLAVGHRYFPKLPSTLIVMVFAAVLVGVVGADRLGVEVVGPIPRGLPTPSLPPLAGLNLPGILSASVGIAIVGYSDTVLTARAFARDSGGEVDAGQELVALGAANIAAGLLHGFPVSSSASRTAIADATGARSQLTSVVAAGMVVLVLLAFGPALATFPIAALGAVVVYAATRLIDVAGLRRLAHFRRSELVLALATTAGVLVVGVLYGIVIAIVLSILDLLRRIARPHDGVLGFVGGVAGMHDIDDYPDVQQIPGLVIYRYDSPLFFANASNFLHRALRAVQQAEAPVRWLVLNAEANVELDSTAVDALEDLRATLERRGIILGLTRVKFEVATTLDRVGFLQRVGPEHVFMTLPTAVAAYHAWLAQAASTPPEGQLE